MTCSSDGVPVKTSCTDILWLMVFGIICSVLVGMNCCRGVEQKGVELALVVAGNDIWVGYINGGWELNVIPQLCVCYAVVHMVLDSACWFTLLIAQVG